MFVTSLVLGGCLPDDWNGEPYVPTTAAPTGDTAEPSTDPASLVGSWRSEGEDLSELFAEPPFGYVQVDVRFGADERYTVTSVDGNGASYELSGTYTASTDTVPGVITLSQSEPYEAEASGLWAVSADELTYEVVQTVPDYGFAPPTPEGGFGSTAGPGMDPGVNVQRYRRQP